MGSNSEFYINPFDLLKYLENKVCEINIGQNIVIIGDSGSGKTLLLLKLTKVI
jgi:ABC-type phosphate/phosphonate transport system ATPase subunit